MAEGTVKTTDELTDELTGKIRDRTEASERIGMVRGFQDNPDVFLLAGLLAVLTGVATRMVRLIRRRRAVRPPGSTESPRQAAERT